MNRPGILSYLPIVLTVLFASCEPKGQNRAYEPIPLFAPAYQALGNADSTYNLDATMRIIRAMEKARGQLQSFDSFMDMLAQQDYRYVAPDVLEAQKKLFPVLQEMYLLEKENDKFEGILGLVNATEGALGDIGNNLLSNPGGDLVVLLKGVSITGTVGEVFQQYSKVHKIKENNLRMLNSLQEDYVSALKESWPVFLKYKEQWEKLCILKDQAYLDVYDGRNVSAYNLANEILDFYPDDRDGLLIKALALAGSTSFDPGEQLEAEAVLDKYVDLYPSRTAPAFMIRGIIASRTGNQEKAFSYFDHASIEYPRQAAALTDMLDAYLNRPYFSKTHEGLYFQQMYKATLEGYGAFSPNFQKAISYEHQGNMTAAAKEIYDHFFRRGNQAVFDYLLSDMEFCDKQLHGVFNGIFPERELVNLIVEGKKNIMGKPRLDITLENNTGRALPNVRLFLCHHLVGMYPGDYVVEDLSPVNYIANGESYKWESREYAEGDIVYSRAVMLTDNHICWVDTPEYKAQLAIEVETPKDTIISIPAPRETLD